MNLEIIGLIAGALSCFTFVPQIFKTYQTRSVKDVSLSTFVIIFISTLIWLYYGIEKNAPSIIITNIVVNLSAAAMIVMKFVFEKQSKDTP